MKYIATKGDRVHCVVLNKQRKQAIGCIARIGEVFKKCRVFAALDDLTEFTSDCLREIADFMDAQDNEERDVK